MANPFKNARLMMIVSVLAGFLSLILGVIGLYYKEYIIGGILIFNIFICFVNFKSWQNKS